MLTIEHLDDFESHLRAKSAHPFTGVLQTRKQMSGDFVLPSYITNLLIGPFQYCTAAALLADIIANDPNLNDPFKTWPLTNRVDHIDQLLYTSLVPILPATIFNHGALKTFDDLATANSLNGDAQFALIMQLKSYLKTLHRLTTQTSSTAAAAVPVPHAPEQFEQEYPNKPTEIDWLAINKASISR